MSDANDLSSSGDPSHEADFLVDQYLTGRLTEAEATRLLSLLRTDPDLGQGLLVQLNVDALLRDVSQSEKNAADRAAWSPPVTTCTAADEPGVAGVTPRARARRLRTFAAWALTTAACVAIVTSVSIRTLSNRHAAKDPKPEVETAPAEPTSSAVAVMARSVDAVWVDGSPAPAAGAPLERGWLRLTSGLAEVEFYSGARVVLQGPGALQLVSATEAYCPSGRLSAEVPPPAKGFRIDTPRGAVVDLGTSFGLDVTAGGAEVHVFEGEVELHPTVAAAAAAAAPATVPADAKRGLREGEAAAVGADGALRLFGADATVFPSAERLDERAGDALRRRQQAWRAASARWNADPDLLVRFDFEDLQPGGRTLANRAASAGPNAPAAAIVGSGRAEGRWPGKGALEFRGVSDRVRLDVPGEFASVTFAAWVRANGIDRTFNSLFMTDAFPPGATHWQILRNGRVRLGVAAAGRPHTDYDSPVVFAPERLGQWIHLAVVYDAAARQVTHYVDGRRVSQAETTKAGGALRIGPAEVGNWNPGPKRDPTPIRHFSGRIDEFAVYKRALSDAEVIELFQAGSGAATTP